MMPDSTEVGPGVGTLGPSLSMRKGEVGVGGGRMEDLPTKRCRNKVAPQGEEGLCWR